jgi:hypothetical protein
MSTSYITKEGIEDWLKETSKEFAAHHGSGYSKSLNVTLKGQWFVISWRNELYRGDMDTAIDTYNSILPKKQNYV